MIQNQIHLHLKKDKINNNTYNNNTNDINTDRYTK